jgi:glycosyltransferase involved in cell wall biosynthesis
VSQGDNPVVRILLLSPYDTRSHRRWREGLVATFPEHDWTVLTLPPRHFIWRVRGNSLSWALGEHERLRQPYDAVVATSMTDLSALRGMVPSLAAVPAMVYFHENQFAYPDRREQQRIEPAVVSLYAALSAAQVVFNSDYNRQTFLQGVDALLRRLPDHVPPGVADRLAERSTVIPVPLDAFWLADGPGPSADAPLTLVWNHRWEYDKAPERLFAALLKLHEAGEDFRMHVIGHRFRTQPDAFEAARPVLQAHIGEWGTVEGDDDYRRVLRGSHVVLSTALHEFQGLAVQEAVACGCLPLVPDRLAYPEFFPDACRYPSHPEDAEREAGVLAERLALLAEQHRRGDLPAAPVSTPVDWPALAGRYAEVMALTAGQ